MKGNKFALNTFKYIWSHPNCKQQRILSITRFLGWQFYKRLTGRYLDFQILPKIRIRCYPDSCSASAALYCGLYDYHEMHFLLRYLQPEDVFLDIGANIGVYTLLAASRISSGSIHSFEVLPRNHRRLQENLKINQLNRVVTYEIAVSDRAGNITLNVAEGDSMPFITESKSVNTITVPTNTLNSLIQEELINKITLVKMDIEGAELLALQGATSLLQQQRPLVWILEINDTVKHFNYQKQDIVTFLHDYGYSLYHYDAVSNQITSITLENQQGKNVFAIADSAVEFVRHRLNIGFSQVQC